GQTEMSQNKFDEALVDYNKAVELAPTNPVVYDRRGFAYYNLRKYDEAIKDYTASIEKKPDNPLTFNRRADSYYAMGNYAPALAASLPTLFGGTKRRSHGRSKRKFDGFGTFTSYPAEQPVRPASAERASKERERPM